MTDTDYSPLKSAAMAASKGTWAVEPSAPGACTGSWIHDGERHHVADNVGRDNAAFIAVAHPQKIITLVDDLAQERSLRLSAEQELAELRRENEMLRIGVKGDFDLDAWLTWSIDQQKRQEVQVADYQRQVGQEQALQEDGTRFRHLMFNYVDWAQNGKDDDAVVLSFGPYPSHGLRAAVDADIAKTLKDSAT